MSGLLGTKGGTAGGGEATELEGWDKGDKKTKGQERSLLSPLGKELLIHSSLSLAFH